MQREMTLEQIRQLEELLTTYQIWHATEREIKLLKGILPNLRRKLTRMQEEAEAPPFVEQPSFFAEV